MRPNFRRSKQEIESFYDQDINYFASFQEIEKTLGALGG